MPAQATTVRWCWSGTTPPTAGLAPTGSPRPPRWRRRSSRRFHRRPPSRRRCREGGAARARIRRALVPGARRARGAGCEGPEVFHRHEAHQPGRQGDALLQRHPPGTLGRDRHVLHHLHRHLPGAQRAHGPDPVLAGRPVGQGRGAHLDQRRSRARYSAAPAAVRAALQGASGLVLPHRPEAEHRFRAAQARSIRQRSGRSQHHPAHRQRPDRAVEEGARGGSWRGPDPGGAERRGRSVRSPLACAGLLVAALASGLAAPAAPPAGDARRGKQIYLRGAGSSGEVLASLGDGAADVPASVLPCASCHGHDGEGRPEGGVAPSAITWERLTKPYGMEQEGGRSHPPYNEESLARAITEGLDPAGNRLQVAMPRYRMSRADLADLIAFLHRLGRDTDPGVGEGQLVLGTFVPRQGPQAAIGETMRAVLAAQLERVNSEGGVYGRRLELRVLRPEQGAAALEGIFALVGGLPGAQGMDLAALAEEHEVPLVAPVILDPQPSSPPGRFVFYLLSGLREQALALASFAGQTIPTRELRALIVHPDLPRSRELAKALEQRRKD